MAVVLVILDGVGISYEERGNAIMAAKKPNLDEISRYYPGTALQSYGMAVGVPWGEVGNSEVGHLTIGSGQAVYQDLPRINASVQDGSFFKNPAWQKALEHAQKNNSAVHLMGLVSNGGVHSHMNHLFALLKFFSEKKFAGPVYIHVFTDGRDAPTQSAPVFIKTLQDNMARYKIGKIATVSGRYYAMDRDKHWERIQMAMDAILGKGEKAKSAEEAIQNSYAQKITDEFIKPIAISGKQGDPIGALGENDAMILFNFRPDRARQLTEALLLVKKDFKNLFLASMTQYDKDFKIPIAFPIEIIENSLAKLISQAGKKQLHIAETEKYAHITYFLNGGVEEPFSGEERALIPSPKVAGYDQKPEMSAYEVAEKTVEAIQSKKYDFIALNFANGDMVGHTGNLQATIKAVEILDECLGKIKNAVLETNGAMIITADHGNCEEVINLETGEIDTSHSTNPVPFWIVETTIKKDFGELKKTDVPTTGILADVAPTILELLKISQPKEMVGKSLFGKIGRLAI